MDSFTLDDDVELTGKVIARFSYKGMEQPVTSWVDMYQKVLKLLHSEDKSVLSGLAYTSDDTVELSLHVSHTNAAFSKCVEIDTGIYIWTNINTQYKVNTLRKFFALYGADPEDLVFYMRDDAEEESAIVGTRYEIRKKYWQFALPDIQAAHADTGSFSNVTRTKENWLAGFFGFGGCSINCVANFDCARVEMYFGTNDKMLNKKLFDAVAAHRTAIESVIGTAVWDRGDDKKSSRIYVELNSVSINQEIDWPRMRKFHAEMSKKIYNAIIPYILNEA